MVRVKICGITTVDDALHAVSCGADALGFVFFDKSPRCVDVDLAAEIVNALPPFVSAVGLFVNESRQRVQDIMARCRLDLVQFHGDETPADCYGWSHRVIKALRVKDRQSLAGHAEFDVSALLLDAYAPGAYGGTGSAFDWSLAAELARVRPLVLAGGLSPENVSQAVSVVRPYAVDVSSGVEESPGRKDPEKVKAFIRFAKGNG